MKVTTGINDLCCLIEREMRFSFDFSRSTWATYSIDLSWHVRIWSSVASMASVFGLRR
ncbi:hypothetical protein BX600DRAFT_463006 [Xylariales sp. PMI_506]|nr:hypothetical protein BX600DRAFT_463006 [Xylariales sp. PMI_506]